ncbi:caspase family protein [Rhodobacter sp. SY28-1]|uniref:caspase family protein n=1 Tax=Rhodobacter sp. SY28-1 TaxID=2562317 RepID=UPI0010C04132|nr:caspase family protein [Rhodobacter sp. SY28-1]
MRAPFALVLCTTLLAPPAQAEIRAVIVGVSDYLTLDADLKGPANDARLMAETLIARGVSPAAITVLTSDPTDLPTGITTGQPTRAEILGALETATEASTKGDTVVFTFSGHGAQAPDLSGDEGGGYDELLLSADATGWKGAIGSVENAIIDDDLQAWAQATLAKGIQVIGLIDACHSATGFRAVGGQGVAKVIDEAQLGIPDDVVPVAGTPAPPLSGDFVFLYSSQSDQRSFEYPMPDGTWHGEFTLRLAQTLRAAPSASWAQILSATTEAMVQGPARQMPDGEGPLLTAQVFGTGPTTTRFPLEAGKLAAGLLDGLTEGAELTLFATPTGGDPLATMTLTNVTAREATLSAPPPIRAQWAELTSAPAPAPLTLAAPVLADPGDPHDYSAWTAALPEPGATPDLVPILTDDTLALAGPDGTLDPQGPGSTPRLRLEPGETPADAVERSLTQAAHGLAIRKTLAGATGRSLTGKAPLAVTIDRRAAVSCDQPGPATPFDPDEPVAPCDQLWLTITNASGTAQDVSVLYFTADFRVQPIYPTQNLSNRLAPGETTRIGLQIEPDSTAGLEEIWTLAVPATPDAPRVDLTRLATNDTTRATPPDPMTAWLEARLDPDATSRGFTLKPAPLTMLRQVLRLTPGDPPPDPTMEN